jgi:peptidoglycan/LPS O-acetylase OafA/YrhL
MRSANQTLRPDGYMVQLDGLRALAVLLVIFEHTWAIPGVKLGRVGVLLFYVLSGFLITGILLQARAKAAGVSPLRQVLGAFYARRSLRIFPLCYLVLAAAVLLRIPPLPEHLGSLLTYTSNFATAAQGKWLAQPFGHFWSLAVEEQFYLFWPALVLFVPARFLLPAMVAMILVGPASRFALLLTTENYITFQVVTPSCLDTLGAGSLLALLAQRGGLAGQQRLLRGALVSGLVLFALIPPVTLLTGKTFLCVFGDTACMLVFVWLVGRASTGFGGMARGALELRPLVYLGTISYGVYIYHYFIPPLARVLGNALGVSLPFPYHTGPAQFVCVTAVTLGIAALSWHLFEQPLNNLKRYFPYVKPRAAPRADACGAAVEPAAAA